jgi:hypothetical protein
MFRCASVWRSAAIAGLLTSVMVATLSGGASAAPSSHVGSSPGVVAARPAHAAAHSPGAQETAIDARTSNDVWAVGEANSSGYPISVTYAEHDDGTSWTHVPTPSPGGFSNVLEAVSADSATDAWAVGQSVSLDGDYVYSLLALHWDGDAWSQVSVPIPGGQLKFAELSAVSTISATDAWAIGFGERGEANVTFVEHWNGTKWMHVPNPEIPGASGPTIVAGLSAISPTDVWLSAAWQNRQGVDQNASARWNGSSWRIYKLPDRGSGDNDPTGIDAVSAHDVWMVGRAFGSDAGPVIEHFDGKTWTLVQPAVCDGCTLEAVSGSGADDVWAVGLDGLSTYTEHWDGSVWSTIPSPPIGGSQEAHVAHTVNSVSDVSSDDAWAIADRKVYNSMMLHWNGTRWSKRLTHA